MNLRPLSCDEVRQVDKTAIETFGMSGLVLMENAGRGAAERIAAIVPTNDPITILCGKGNNAGDGYVIARHLERLGRQVTILSIVDLESLSGDAKVNAEIARKADIEINIANSTESLKQPIETAKALVDCLLGTGAQGPLRGLYAEAVRVANASSAMRIAIDVPSGLNVDTGEPGEPTFQAAWTLSFVAEKIGFTRKSAKPFVGCVGVVSIGIPQKLLDQIQVGTDQQ
ncbi:Bifunctional NAD(P)H-hydrate repair enzyme Nnr [Planctomycetes bacterium CA13]|uniref:NAD(P)H-hydrate epimerase n=1 Tax=Novipirellula herctigrandis TaxID=2527986 RepID=A0A5C5YMS1_9BACT|nr:Bifunctional NAD(P)H-hydrate repair enzyme Nnr [Planctomycetes bacterium CA13]